VVETRLRDASYTRVRYVQETAVREEPYTVMHPVTEVRQCQQSHTVLRPVQQTVFHTECYTVNEPVTACHTEYADHGCFENHVVCREERPRTRLSWVPAGCTVDPVSGISVAHRAGLYWVRVPRVSQEVVQVWRPNVVARQVAVTTLVPHTIQRQIPTQVCTYQPEQV
jgi:hypothetical protein